MKESLLVSKIMKALNQEHGTLALKLHGGVYQHAGLPDLLVVRNGRAIFFEVKRPGKTKRNRPTLLQEVMLKRLQRHGCVAEVVHSMAGAVETMRRIK